MTQAITIQDTASSTASGQGGQVLITGTPTPGSCALFPVKSGESLAIQIGGTWTGTLEFEESIDNGVTYVHTDAVLQDIDTILQTVTQNCIVQVNTTCDTVIRVRATAAMTGEADLIASAGNAVDFAYSRVLNVVNTSTAGKAASGSAVSGNPVLTGGSDGTNARSFLTDTTGRQLIVNQPNVDSAALITLAAQGAGTVLSADQTNNSGKGVNLGINITVATTASVVFTIQGKDVASGTYYDILSSAAIVSTGFTLLSLYPGLAVSSNVSANALLPKTWRVKAVVTGGSAALTGTVGASVIG